MDNMQIGQWYRHRDKGEAFHVAAVDERSNVQVDDLGYSETEMAPRGRRMELEPYSAAPEAWEHSADLEEFESEGERQKVEAYWLEEDWARVSRY